MQIRMRTHYINNTLSFVLSIRSYLMSGATYSPVNFVNKLITPFFFIFSPTGRRPANLKIVITPNPSIPLYVCPYVTHFTQKVLVGSTANFTNATKTWIATLCFSLLLDYPRWSPQTKSCLL